MPFVFHANSPESFSGASLRLKDSGEKRVRGGVSANRYPPTAAIGVKPCLGYDPRGVCVVERPVQRNVRETLRCIENLAIHPLYE